MPELPEVETVRTGLAAHAEGKHIADVTLRRRTLRHKLPDDFESSLTGITIKVIERRAKYLLVHCSRNTTLIIHLGMSGSLVIHTRKPGNYQKHDHVILHLSDDTEVVYRDPRRFGLMDICSTEKLDNHKLLAHLGPEPLSDTWKVHDLYAALQSSKSPVKSVIMDQTVVVGVGNIYACEALFDARILPDRPSAKVTKAEATALVKAIKKVLQAAIVSGGSTLRDYVRSSGDSGYFQHQFKVYGRSKQPCFRCNTPIAMMRQSGRSSFFCPHCQR